MSRIIVVASQNQHKIQEISQMVGGLPVEFRSMGEYDNLPEIVEDGDTFQANAEIKARIIAAATGHWALGEDSGISVDALGGAPGIYSARFCGEHGDDDGNNQLLLERMADVPDGKRSARYTCAAVLASPDKVLFTAIGQFEGVILRELRGTGGFGYDPLVYIPEYHCSVGQMSPVVKNAISHRARAMQQLVQALPKLLAE